MKCVMNKNTGEIRRVSNELAEKLCGGIIQNPDKEFCYAPKLKWKNQVALSNAAKSKSQGA